jgi:hypothetical protein
MANIARPTKIWDQTLNDWVFLAGVVDTTKSYTYTADQTFPGVTATSYNGGGVPSRNLFINGAFDIWQRGASPTIIQDTNVLTADRMYTYRGGIVNVSVTRQTSDLDGFQYFARIKRTAGDTSTANIHIGTNMETVNVIPLRNKTVTLSFYARAGANFSGSGNILSAYLGSSTDIDAQWINPAGQTQIFQGAPVLTTGWQRFSFTGIVPSNANSLRTVLYYTPSSAAAGSNEYYDITGMQLEVGPLATTFSRAGVNIQQELAMCQRYYAKSYDLETSPGTDTNTGLVYSGFTMTTTTGYLSYQINFPVKMRSAPSFTTYDVADAAGKVTRATPTAADQNGMNPSLAFNSQSSVLVQSPSGLGHSGLAFHWVASAEL